MTLQSAQAVALVAAILTSGLLAGLFYTFSCAVTPGLRRVDDHIFTSTFQAINVAILNGRFLLIFGGTPLLTTVAAVLHIPEGHHVALLWIVAALACHIATLVITGGANVPLNNRLAAAPTATDIERATIRTQFELAWTRWNLVRTLTSTAGFAGLVVAASLQ